jgi:hypothetical protein
MSGIVPPDSLAILRNTWLKHADTNQATVTVPGVSVPDGEGGFVKTDPEVTTYPATQSALGGSEQETVIQERYAEENLSIIFLPHDARVTARSTIVWNGVRQYEVVGIIPQRDLQVRRKVIVRLMGNVEES